MRIKIKLISILLIIGQEFNQYTSNTQTVEVQYQVQKMVKTVKEFHQNWIPKWNYWIPCVNWERNIRKMLANYWN